MILNVFWLNMVFVRNSRSNFSLTSLRFWTSNVKIQLSIINYNLLPHCEFQALFDIRDETLMIDNPISFPVKTRSKSQGGNRLCITEITRIVIFKELHVELIYVNQASKTQWGKGKVNLELHRNLTFRSHFVQNHSEVTDLFLLKCQI